MAIIAGVAVIAGEGNCIAATFWLIVIPANTTLPV